MWLVKCVKNIVSKHLVTLNTLNSLKNCTTVLPSNSFITLAKVELENVRLSVSEILGVFATTMTPDDKYSLRNRKNIPHSVQVQLSKKQDKFLNFLVHI